jgi:hypothetical protein
MRRVIFGIDMRGARAMKWTSNVYPRGTTYCCLTERDGWEILFPRLHPEQPTVELRYGRRTPGDGLFPVMMGIGRFASAGEAMLAARMFEDGAVCDDAAATRGGLGFKPYIDGAEKLPLSEGRKSRGHFLFMTGVGKDRKETGLNYERPGPKEGTHNIARLWAAATESEESHPINAAALHGVETAILMELLRVRMEHGPVHYAVPMSVEDYLRWAEERYGREEDPEADRPYSKAEASVRNAAARGLLLEDAAVRERLGVSPGFEERIRGRADGFDRMLETLMLARARGPARSEILDLLDARIAEIESRLAASQDVPAPR